MCHPGGHDPQVENHCSSTSFDGNILRKRSACCLWVMVEETECGKRSTYTLDHRPFYCWITTNCSKELWELVYILLSQKHLVHSVHYLYYKCRHQRHSEHLQQVKSPFSLRVTLSPGMPLISLGKLCKPQAPP